jgi:arsenate reductase (thioredoxin)
MRYVVFVCTHNAGRSQMAQALFECHAPDDIRAESAGQQPADRIWPEVVEVMREVGIDLTDRRPKRLTVEMQLHADWAITLACGAQCPYVPTTVEDWDIPDPAGRPIEEVRAIREAVEVRVKDLIEQRVDAIRSDPTAHQLRLQRLLPDR